MKNEICGTPFPKEKDSTKKNVVKEYSLPREKLPTTHLHVILKILEMFIATKFFTHKQLSCMLIRKKSWKNQKQYLLNLLLVYQNVIEFQPEVA